MSRQVLPVTMLPAASPPTTSPRTSPAGRLNPKLAASAVPGGSALPSLLQLEGAHFTPPTAANPAPCAAVNPAAAVNNIPSARRVPPASGGVGAEGGADGEVLTAPSRMGATLPCLQ